MSHEDLIEQWPKKWIGASSWSMVRRYGVPPAPPPSGSITTEDAIDITTENDVPLVVESAP